MYYDVYKRSSFCESPASSLFFFSTTIHYTIPTFSLHSTFYSSKATTSKMACSQHHDSTNSIKNWLFYTSTAALAMILTLTFTDVHRSKQQVSDVVPGDEFCQGKRSSPA